MTSDVQENIKAQKVIKGFNLQQRMIAKFTERLQTLSMISYQKNVINAQLERIPMNSLLLINFTIIGFGSYLALTGHITIGALVAFFTMYTSMGDSVFNLTFAIPAFTDAALSMERIQQLWDEQLETSGKDQLVVSEERCAKIEFEHVTFRYTEQQDVLKEIMLQIPSGTTAAFVGSSGSGKSTLVQLLLGFYPPSEGHIRINGQKLEVLKEIKSLFNSETFAAGRR